MLYIATETTVTCEKKFVIHTEFKIKALIFARIFSSNYSCRVKWCWKSKEEF